MKTLIYITLLCSTLMANAQKPIELKVWPNGAPNSNGITNTEEIKSSDRPVKVTEPTLAVYPASHPNGMAVIACPGGGYQHLAMNHEGHDMAAWFNAQGITFAVLKYRMPNGHNEVPLSDAQEAIRIMKSHADEWKINPNKVGIMGASAGGHLASTAATHYDNETKPAFQILLYPVISMDPSISHGGSRKNLLGDSPSGNLINKYSNELQVTQNTPPAFIALSSDDRTVPPANSIRYYEALIANKVPTTMHIYPIGGHGWGFRDAFTYKPQWTGELEKWLRELNK